MFVDVHLAQDFTRVVSLYRVIWRTASSLVAWRTPLPPPSCRTRWRRPRWAAEQGNTLPLSHCSMEQRSAPAAAVTRATWEPGGSRAVGTQVHKCDKVMQKMHATFSYFVRTLLCTLCSVIYTVHFTFYYNVSRNFNVLRFCAICNS